MNKVLRRPIWAATCLLAIFALYSCEKPEAKIGMNLQPDQSLITAGTVDTISLRTYVVRDDSLRSDEFSPALLGAYADPEFGLVKAGHVSQLVLSTAAPDFAEDFLPEEVVVDSVVLILAFQQNTALTAGGDGLYGGNGSQYLQVFEITDDLYVDSAYYNYSEVDYISQNLVKPGFEVFTPNTTDSVMVDGTNRSPQIRVRLDESLGERFVHLSDSVALNSEVFVDYLKGLYITVDESQFNTDASGIIYWNTGSANSGITMYYHTPADTLSYNFVFVAGAAKFNRFEHDYTTGNLNLKSQLDGNYESGQQDLFLQTMGGTKINIELPYLDMYTDTMELAVNKAELIVPVRGASETMEFGPPGLLYLYGVDDNGELYILPDQRDGQTFIGGTYDAASGSYKFLLTRQLQSMLLGNVSNNGLQLVTSRSTYSANRAVINGPQYPDAANPENNMKLIVTFTKL